MRDTELYRQILGVVAPWTVSKVEVRIDEGQILVFVEHDGSTLRCPECERPGPRYDGRERRWRHLDTCQLQTVLVATIPRMRCDEHETKQIRVPWAEPGSRFTALFEALVIDWLLSADISRVAKQLGLSWHEAAGIQDRAVERGLTRRKLAAPTAIGVDETAEQRGHRYVTVVTDLEQSRVLFVAPGREASSLEGFFDEIGERGREGIVCVAMDMHAPYIDVVSRRLPDGESKIVFDKFHIAKHLGDAVDKTRREENRELLEGGDRRLVRTKYLWLSRIQNLTAKGRRTLSELRKGGLRVARAWALKQEAMYLWGYQKRGSAERAWKLWLSWALRSRIEPMKKVARMIRSHWEGVLNAVVSGITNAMSESINAKIQWIKRQARGFRNPERFRRAIYFHLGGLDLYPATVSTIHTKVR